MDSTCKMITTSVDFGRLNIEFEGRSPRDILAWSWETFGPYIAASSSFQTQGVPLLHMIAEVCPDMPVIFVDTGYHFPETLVFRDELQLKLKLNIKTVNPHPKASKSLRGAMESLYEADLDLCCRVHKVKPVIQALHEMVAKAWVMGIRRGQTVERSGIPFFESRSDGIVRVHPVANWNSHDIQTYIDRYNLPVHPLLEKGYTSIGCAPCTRPISEGEDERAGRWSETEKTECGLYATDV